MDSVRNVSIRGDAAAAFMGTRRSTRKQKGGFNSAPGPSIPLGPLNMAVSRKLSSAANAFHTGGAVAQLPQGAPMPQGAQAQAQALPPPKEEHEHAPPQQPHPHPQDGGAKKKLVLAQPKKTKSKVHLAAPASKRYVKGTRKIKIQLSCMKKRLTRAKSIKSDSRQKPIKEIRPILEAAKLIKPLEAGKEDSESVKKVIRDIYQDYMLLRNRVL